MSKDKAVEAIQAKVAAGNASEITVSEMRSAIMPDVAVKAVDAVKNAAYDGTYFATEKVAKLNDAIGLNILNELQVKSCDNPYTSLLTPTPVCQAAKDHVTGRKK